MPRLLSLERFVGDEPVGLDGQVRHWSEHDPEASRNVFFVAEIENDARAKLEVDGMHPARGACDRSYQEK